MTLSHFPVKGIPTYLLDSDLNGEPLHMHVSEVAAGGRSHPPHQHEGVEAVYMLEGEGTLEIADERYTFKAGESVVFDPRKMHGLVNSSDAPMRYLVVLSA